MLQEIVLIDNVEWQGLYINGRLVLEDHRLYASDVVQAIMDACSTIARVEKADEDWLCAGNTLPERYTDVPLQ